ncbi:chromate transporter [Listeria monocytogenes]|nr:chromate transporter [Listeria monocytogenes]EEP2907177.1 chromate transporter [Listeria monocytogenes]EEP2907589.1 chromate transporter [Listeria monocytogenes]EEP6699455.1 chromate transporter [Listeria monocytogenes]HAA9544616.1 chromate transporter [Listeria monocytogenes]
MERLLQLMFVFFKIGLFSIGGGYAIIPLIQRQVVNQYGWINQQTFMDIITISQMTPGPLAVNTSTFVGIQVWGILGAIVATVGCVISGVTISVFLYRFFKKHSRSQYIMEVLSCLKASSLGLIISSAVSILLLSFMGSQTFSEIKSTDWFAIAIFGCSFFVLRKWKANPILVMVITGVIGWIIYSLYGYTA